MNLQLELNFNDVSIEHMNDVQLTTAEIKLDVLRLDKIHPVVSGNKWFKLKYYVQQAIENDCTSIATFGGAFSNHILATAYCCNKQNLSCIGYIRGEGPAHYSQTLLDAKALNMQLIFLSREDYANDKSAIDFSSSIYFIPEGGYGETGAKGAKEILEFVPHLSDYNYIICACGTGTMLAGIANAGFSHQQYIGVSVMKNNFSLQNEVLSLANDEAKSRIKILHYYHFGGYAKYTQALIDFINKIYQRHQLPLDFVYTAKALFAIYDLAEKKYFNAGSKILFIHSGGLQGNRSLGKKLINNSHDIV
jgi:1-aminocyclopropane-1-carboxylate deaminase/D-cysteine desulfhydrase-like pyridoxal-dependent ACC family enzyme